MLAKFTHWDPWLKRIWTWVSPVLFWHSKSIPYWYNLGLQRTTSLLGFFFKLPSPRAVDLIQTCCFMIFLGKKSLKEIQPQNSKISCSLTPNSAQIVNLKLNQDASPQIISLPQGPLFKFHSSSASLFGGKRVPPSLSSSRFCIEKFRNKNITRPPLKKKVVWVWVISPWSAFGGGEDRVGRGRKEMRQGSMWDGLQQDCNRTIILVDRSDSATETWKGLDCIFSTQTGENVNIS